MLRAIIFISVLSLYLYPSQAIAKNQPGDLLQIRTFLSQAMQEALLIEVDEKSTKDDSCGVFGPPSLPVLDKVEFLAKIGLTQSVVGGSKNHERFAPALKLTGRLHNEENRNRAYSIIVKAQARAGDIEGAYQTTALIKNPTWQVYPFVLITAAHMAAGQQGEAQRLLRGGRKALGQPGEDLYHEAFVEAQAENGFIREALEVSGLIGSRQARTNAIRMIAESQLEQGDRKGAEATLLAGKTRTDGFNNEETKHFSKQMDRALLWMGVKRRIQSKIGEVISRPKDWSELLEISFIQARTGDIRGALRTYETYLALRGEDPPGKYVVDTYHDILPIGMAYAKSGDLSQSRKFFRAALENVLTSKDDYCIQDYVIKEIARAQTSAGDVNNALTWFSKLKTPILRSHAFFGLAQGHLDNVGIRLPSLPGLFPELDHSMVFRSPE